jgi:hypothetical protein
MFRERYQAAFVNLFHANPLSAWEQRVESGYVKRVTDQDIRGSVTEIMSPKVHCTFITCPKDPTDELAIKLPILVLGLKYLNKYFTVEIQILDDLNARRRFRASNYQSRATVKPFVCNLPMRLDPGWGQVRFNLPDLTRRAYGSGYVETIRVTVFANCRIRRVYFCDRLYAEDELPPEYRLVPSKPEMLDE